MTLGTCPVCRCLVSISKPNRHDGMRRVLWHRRWADVGCAREERQCSGTGQPCVEDAKATKAKKDRRTP